MSPKKNATDQSSIVSNAIRNTLWYTLHCISMKLVTIIASNNRCALYSHIFVYTTCTSVLMTKLACEIKSKRSPHSVHKEEIIMGIETIVVLHYFISHFYV